MEVPSKRVGASGGALFLCKKKEGLGPSGGLVRMFVCAEGNCPICAYIPKLSYLMRGERNCPILYVYPQKYPILRVEWNYPILCGKGNYPILREEWYIGSIKVAPTSERKRVGVAPAGFN